MEWTTYCAVNNHSALLTGLRHCTAKSTGDFHWGKSLRMSSRSFSATISIRQFVLCLHCAAAEQKRLKVIDEKFHSIQGIKHSDTIAVAAVEKWGTLLTTDKCLMIGLKKEVQTWY